MKKSMYVNSILGGSGFCILPDSEQEKEGSSQGTVGWRRGGDQRINLAEEV
ncbi:hypothetical protein [Archangium lipolyticum]|uniref:hypothetical protein n=1 Tax=Archangium lipolyticum TaxID=2970465 RepID=UPI00214A83E1|nr:hypothetical protein [Archangium lipolyticum]